MADPETGMKKAEMKKMLRRSFGEGMGCAVGIGENPAYGLFLMHRVRRGKALEKMLKDEFPDAKNVRFGTAFVTEDEPKKVQLSLNRAAPGIARKLVKTFKGTGFTKVVIASEDGETEDCEEADETPEIPDEEGADGAVSAEAAPAPAPPPPPPPPAAAERPDPGELAKRLAGLIPRIAIASAGDPARTATLSKLAKDAGVNLKTNNLKTSADLIEQLAGELDKPAAAAAAPAPNKGALGARLSTAISGLNKLPPGEQKAALTRLAGQAGALVKADNLGEAEATLDRLEREMAAPPAPPPPQRQVAGNPADAAALTGQLAALIPQIAAAASNDAERQADLSKLARQAGVEIKTGNLTYAANSIAQLSEALQRPASSTDAVDPAIPAARIEWISTRQQIAGNVRALGAALADTYAGQPLADRIVRLFQAKVDPLLAQFDDRLGTALADLASAPDEDKRKDHADDARAYIREYREFTETDAFITDLDENPFVKIDIRSRTLASLARVEQALG